MSKSNDLENKILNGRYNTTYTRPANWHAALFKTWPGEAAAGAEADYTGYARVAMPTDTTTFPASTTGQLSNGIAITFPPCTGGPMKARFVGYMDAASGGNLGDYGGLGPTPVAFTGATSDTITAAGHGLVVGDEVVFYAPRGATLPGGITEGAVYFAKTVSGNDITISATSGGATLDITSAGAGLLQKIVGLDIANAITPVIGIGQFVVYED